MARTRDGSDMRDDTTRKGVWQVEVWQGDSGAQCWCRTEARAEELRRLADVAVKRSDRAQGIEWGLTGSEVFRVDRADARGPSGVRSGEELWMRGAF